MATASSTIAASVVLSPQASAATQYSLLAASSLSAQPAFAASSVYLAALAVLDSSGRTKKFYDSQVISDAVALGVSKPLSDAIAPAQSYLSLHFRRPLADSFSTTDYVVVVKTFLREFSDSISAPDAHVFSLSRPLSDSVSAQQTLVTRSYAKNLADAFGLNDHFDANDGSTYSFTKSINNAAFVSDGQVFGVSKSLLDDVVSPSDAYALGVSKPLSDSFSTVENTALALAKRLADTFSLSQTLVLGTSKVLADTVSLPDAAYYNMAKQLSDTQAVADQGSLVAQSYCDITYFEADYVGEYREFT